MGCFDDGMRTISEPYGGNMPLFNSPNTSDATVTIVSESYDDGMKVTRIQTPPRTETKSLIEIIDSVLGYVSDLDIGSMDKSDNKKDKNSDKDGDDNGNGIRSDSEQDSKRASSKQSESGESSGFGQEDDVS